MSSFNSVIGIHGVPRSGTSWLAQIVNSDPAVRLKFQPLFSFSFKNVLNEESNLEALIEFYNGIWENDSDVFLNMKDPDIHKNYPLFKKNRLENVLAFKQVHHHYLLPMFLEEDKNIKLIFLIRNPLGILASWKKAPREFDPDWDFLEEWQFANLKNRNIKENYFGFEKWKEATQLFLSLKNKYVDRVFLLEYGELLSETRLNIKNMFDFIGLSKVSEHTINFINSSKLENHNDPNSVFKNKREDNSWMSELPASVIRKVKSDTLFMELNKKYNWV